jgi:lipopolysaccharide export system permease protein
VRLIRRYLLRQLTGPFFYALAGLTGFMLLNQVARRFGQLVGKGLEWSVIAEVFGLSVPFIVAMTLPMAVLVAVLYTFSHLAADNEVTAMRAGGISVQQILGPVVLWGVLMAAANFVFVDQVLPRSNARLRALLVDIGRKKPTFALHEQVINEIPPSQYFLRAGRIDPGSGRMRDVVIYDVGDQRGRRIIYADSGLMGYAPGQTDLSLMLYDGRVHELKTADPSEFRLTYFRTNHIRVKNVFDQLQRNSANETRGDREMSTCEMLGIVHQADQRRGQAETDRATMLTHDLRTLLMLPPLPVPPGPALQPLPRYCRPWRDLLHGGVKGTVQRDSGAQTAKAKGAWKARHKLPASLPPSDTMAQPAGTAPAVDTAVHAAAPQALGETQAVTLGVPGQPVAAPSARPPLSTWTDIMSAADRSNEADHTSDRYLVEVHKKWSISVACITFVLMGVVLALRFPRGGIGLVVGGGFGVFAIFYVFLTAGEALSDRGIVSPALSMWGPNLLFTLAGLIGLALVNRESGSTRGGDWQEVLEGLRNRLSRWRRRV